MVLGSQAPRAGTSRKYMVSSGRRKSKALPLAIVAVVVCAIVGIYVFLGDDDATDDTQTVSGSPGDTNAVVVPAPTPPAVESATPTPHIGLPARTPIVDERSKVPDLTLNKPAHDPLARTNSDLIPPPTPETTTPPHRRPAVHGDPAHRHPRTTAALVPATTERSSDLRHGMDLIADSKYVEGRAVLSNVLYDDPRRVTPADAQTIRDTLESINAELVYSNKIIAGDPLVEAYTVQSGDYLSRVAPRYHITYQLIERINNVQANRIRVGQQLKIVKGPFHAKVYKHDYRMDLYLNDPEGKPIYISSLPVGLGAEDATPTGSFLVAPGSKVANPGWTNPRTNQSYGRDDPSNPIGEYWLALQGTDDNTKGLRGYGIHGTIDPESIGTQASMGCIRLRDQDIKLVYDMLSDGKSTVEILP